MEDDLDRLEDDLDRMEDSQNSFIPLELYINKSSLNQFNVLNWLEMVKGAW